MGILVEKSIQGEMAMPTPGSVRCFLDWATESANEMDATPAPLESKANEGRVAEVTVILD